MGALSNGQLDNLIVSNHGIDGRENSLFAIEENINMSEDNSISTSEIQSYNTKGGKDLTEGEKEVNIFTTMASKVRDKGNFIFNFCEVGKGQHGKTTLAELKILLADRINIYLPTSFVATPSLLYDTGRGLNANGVLNYDSNTKWIRSKPGVKDALKVNSIQMSKKSESPIKIN